LSSILISASAPGTVPSTPAAPQPTFPAVYVASLDATTQVATMTPLFYDEATATVANVNASDYGQIRAAGMVTAGMVTTGADLLPVS
jgi:hypothetical protein